jgi:hypothetical protein
VVRAAQQQLARRGDVLRINGSAHRKIDDPDVLANAHHSRPATPQCMRPVAAARKARMQSAP